MREQLWRTCAQTSAFETKKFLCAWRISYDIAQKASGSFVRSSIIIIFNLLFISHALPSSWLHAAVIPKKKEKIIILFTTTELANNTEINTLVEILIEGCRKARAIGARRP